MFCALVFINHHDRSFVNPNFHDSIVSLLTVKFYIMKKRNLTSLVLNKKSISNLDPKQSSVNGGINKTNALICTSQCSVNPVYCNTLISCPNGGICD